MAPTMTNVSQLRRVRLPREQRREQILDIALELVARDGFGSASMEGIAREANVAKTVLYGQFGDLDGLIQALLLREQDRAWHAIAAATPSLPLPEDPVEVVVSVIRSILGDVARRPHSWRLLLLTPDGAPPALRVAIQTHRDLLVEQMTPFVAWMLLRGGLAGLDEELTTHTILAATENAARLMLTAPDQYPLDRIIAFVTGAAVKALSV